MPEPTNASDSASSFGAAIAFWIFETVAAFVVAWLLAGTVCLWSARLHLRLADFTCGHNIGLPFALFFFVLWPTFLFALPVLLRRHRTASRPSNNRWRGP
jgi:hypothetical protein